MVIILSISGELRCWETCWNEGLVSLYNWLHNSRWIRFWDSIWGGDFLLRLSNGVVVIGGDSTVSCSTFKGFSDSDNWWGGWSICWWLFIDGGYMGVWNRWSGGGCHGFYYWDLQCGVSRSMNSWDAVFGGGEGWSGGNWNFKNAFSHGMGGWDTWTGCGDGVCIWYWNFDLSSCVGWG